MFSNGTTSLFGSTPDPRRRDIISPAVPDARQTLMCVPASRPAIERSFEEQRVEDYLTAYTATGRPPQPVPTEPTGERPRLALGLPPLFQPYIDRPDAGTPHAVSFTDPKSLPLGQEFKWVDNSEDKVRYGSISCMKEFMHFSHEELRHFAYLSDHKSRPDFIPLVQDPVSNPTITLSTPSNSSTNEQFQSITATPAFEKHSFEELRVAYLLANRELDSAAILQAASQAPPAPTTTAKPSLFAGTSSGSTFAPSLSLRPS